MTPNQVWKLGQQLSHTKELTTALLTTACLAIAKTNICGVWAFPCSSWTLVEATYEGGTWMGCGSVGRMPAYFA